MKSRILIAAALAVLAVPAASFAGTPNGQDRANGARDCRALRASMTPELFRLAYGTVQSNRQNAFGRCVSMWARSEHQARISARSACNTERSDANFAASHDGKTFAEFYGTGPQHRNAFGRCVSSKAKAASGEAQQATVNAANTCKAERADMGPAEFRAMYGRNASDRNAFGKCVAQHAKDPSP